MCRCRWSANDNQLIPLTEIEHARSIERRTATDNRKDKGTALQVANDGEPGELLYLNKNILEIDHSYQRNAKNARVLKLARRWNWLSCGVLTVAKRSGRYYVVDGQHRLMAALKRADIDQLPCLVFESSEMREEAVAFRDANKERRPINSF